MADGCQRSRVTEAYTLGGQRSLAGFLEADVTYLKKSRDISLCSFGRKGLKPPLAAESLHGLAEQRGTEVQVPLNR
jgi:hypothetical protein